METKADTRPVTARAGTRRALRLIAWLRVAFGVLAALTAARIWAHLGREDRALNAERRAARRLLHGLVGLGPVGIKLGQTLSTRVDILPRSWRDILQLLQDAVPPEPPDYAPGVLRAELGDRLGTLLCAVDPVPHAAASMAQVHRGRLHDGQSVAVKIRRPDLAGRIAVDGALLRSGSALLAWWTRVLARRPGRRLPAGLLRLKALPWQRMADDFLSGLEAQMDFLAEATNAERFLANMAGTPGILAPRPIRELTTSSVLVMEWIDGVKFHDLEGMARMGVDFRGPVRLGVTCFVTQLLEHGFFHADTHPGNILVTPKGEVAYLDWGLVATFPTAVRLALVSCFLDLVREDWEGLIDGLTGLGMFPEDVDRDRLVPLLRDLVDIQIGRKGTRMLPLGEVLERLTLILEDQPFHLPDTLATLARTAITMEGMVLATWPEFKFLEVALPAAARLMLTGAEPSLRQRLLHEWLPDGRLDLDRITATLEMAAREQPLPAAAWLPEAMDWLLAGDGRPLGDALIAVAWPKQPDADSRANSARLATLIDRDLDLERLDVVDLARRLGPWLVSEDGLAWLGDCLGRLGQQPHDDPLLLALLRALAQHPPAHSARALPVATDLVEATFRQPRTWWQQFPHWLATLPGSPGARELARTWLPETMDAAGELTDEALMRICLALAAAPIPLTPFLQAAIDLLLANAAADPWMGQRLVSVLSGRPAPVLLALGRVAARPEVAATLARRSPELARWSLRALLGP
ncbi:MAG: AarF/UbiB family protein [Candidatus Sericytochromatia bacterium]|nr:AarF/UbiB family protein [Candidatus Sericytochromatia bacterium]